MAKVYVNISFPSDLVKDIDNFVKKSGNRYRSRSEFAISSVREKLERERK